MTHEEKTGILKTNSADLLLPILRRGLGRGRVKGQ